MTNVPYSVLNLLPHNQEIHSKIVSGFLDNKVVGFIQATGTGKTFVTLQYILENPDKQFLFITPYQSIIEHINEIIKSYNLRIYNLQLINYQTLITKNDQELARYKFDYLVLDEFQHLGAPVWGAKIDSLISSHQEAKILGMTAYTIRDRGTIYERDMALPDGDELFSDNIVARYDLVDAILDGVLPTPRYKSTHLNLIEYINKVIDKLGNKEEYADYIKKLEKAKLKVNNRDDSQKLIIDNIRSNGKYIYFCPSVIESGVNDIDTIMRDTKRYLLNNGYKEEDIVFYKSTSDYKDAKNNRELFYNDLDFNNMRANKKLRIMFCINQYNEGVHAPNIDGVILGRSTKSDMVFFEQIGRALNIKGNTYQKYVELSQYSLIDLINYCSRYNIKIKSDNKEEIIKEILTPTIIDLSDNYDYMMELVNELKDKKKKYRPNKDYNHRIINIEDIDFDIYYLHQNIFDLLQSIESTIITYSWEEAYELAFNYYKEYNNLLVPRHFKTNDGINISNFGYDLGEWISRNRVDYKNGKLSQERIDLLNKIDMKWQVTKSWNDAYLDAKEYYKENNNLKIPSSYITKDGYRLGNWLAMNRSKYRKGLLSKDKIKLLEDLNIEWNIIYSFEDAYSLLESYYKRYGNINIPSNFKTSNGIDYDSEGYNLYSFVKLQKDKYSNNELSIEHKRLLEKLDIVWPSKSDNNKPLSFDESYILLNNYYNNYGNLDIKRSFKSFDGVTPNSEGYSLGAIISRLRIKYKNKKLSNDQIRLLESIGMIWQVSLNVPKSWNEALYKAKEYYLENNNLLVPATYKSDDGFALGNWIYLQRKNRSKLDENQINLLNDIGMVWDLKKDTKKIYDLCISYNIPFNKYIDILSHLTYQDFYARLRYLETTIGIYELNGEIHPIFSMSDEALIENYNLTREDLIRNYLPRSKKRGLN